MPIRRAKISKQNSKISNGGWAVRSHDKPGGASLFFSPKIIVPGDSPVSSWQSQWAPRWSLSYHCLCLLSVNPASFSPPLLPTHTQGQTEDLVHLAAPRRQAGSKHFLLLSVYPRPLCPRPSTRVYSLFPPCGVVKATWPCSPYGSQWRWPSGDNPRGLKM